MFTKIPAGLLSAFCVLTLFSAWTGQAGETEERKPVRIAFFTVENCPDCERVKELIDSLHDKFRRKFDISYYDLDDVIALRLNEMLCRAFEVPRDRRRIAPALFSAEEALVHEEITEEAFLEMVNNAENTNCPVKLHGGDFADAEPVRQRNIVTENDNDEAAVSVVREQRRGRALLTFFSKYHCADCRRAERIIKEAGESLRENEGLTVDVRKMYIDYPKGAETAASYLSKLGTGERVAVPAVVSSAGVYIEDGISRDSVRRLARRAEGEPPPEAVFSVEDGKGSGVLANRFRELTIGTVTVGGLADGIFNPCAFTVIIFFIAYLTQMGASRRRVLFAGLTFMGAVFMTYTALSAGLLRALIFSTAVSTWLSYALMLATGGLVLFISAMSFRDAAAVRTGGAERMRLGLPENLNRYMRSRITHRARSGATVFGMIGLGMVVAAIELPCTGMMLVPIVVVLSWAAQVGEFGWAPYGWLLLYNLAFILPLMFVFVLVYCGVTSKQLTSYFSRHLFASKIVLAVVFLLLAVLLFALPLMDSDRIMKMVFG